MKKRRKVLRDFLIGRFNGLNHIFIMRRAGFSETGGG